MPANTLLWSPSKDKIENSLMADFMKIVERGTGNTFDYNYHKFWEWSCDNIPTFWDAIYQYCGVIGDKGNGDVLKNPEQMPGATFFPSAKLNYAENMLRRKDDVVALIFRDEKGQEREMTYQALHDEVSRWQKALKAVGVAKGDRVAAFMPHMPETIIAMLAAVSLGAIWSSASPDFGVQGVIDRFGQTKPKILIAVDGYYYGGKTVDCIGKLKDIQPQLNGLEKTIIVPFAGGKEDISTLDQTTISMDDFLAAYTPAPITYDRVEFNHPLFIMFSSGTTGAPKCIVHGHGGTLLQHLKELKLHCDIKPKDKVFYFTTCGWMMWNWIVSALGCEATILLYDGSPFYPNGEALWEYTSKHDCKLFGTSAKYIDALKAHNIHPGEKYDLSALEVITSTGSPLVHESFDFVYAHIKKDVHLASISGGTDIVSCFVLGNPLSPVYRGEIQGAGLGLAVNSYADDGTPEALGESGELVCTKPFPCMPVSFWNDENGEKYKSAYFGRFDNIWAHGDWIEKTEQGGFIIHGRSDATLNPGGVRIGTAEIYRQVEKIDSVLESIAVGQNWDGDVRVILFVTMKDGYDFTKELKDEIKQNIRKGASPRHVPAKIIPVADIPRTKSGKITELAVHDVIHGRKVKNVEALANPEALELYEDLAELQM